MSNLKLNLNNLNRKIEKVFEQVARDYAIAQVYELEEDKWAWNRVTVRRNGTVVFTPRNIVDTGDLRNSLSLKIQSESAVYRYSLPYAAIVHEGGKTAKGKIYPARPWTQSALDEDPPIDNFFFYWQST